MDFVTALRFVHLHNDKVLAVLIALFLLTAITLLLRSIGKGGESARAGAGSGAPVDVETIEAAMRKVLGTQVPHVSSSTETSRPHSQAAVPSAISVDGPIEAALALIEREKQIEVLQIALKAARDEAALAASSATLPEEGAGTPAVESVMRAKLYELEAKLSEYEIITDDIADLSLFKDENSRMKVEIEEMRAKMETALAAAQAVPTAVALAPPVSRIAIDQESELKFEKAEKFELDINDDVMKAFAEAVDAGRIDKVDGAYSLPHDEVEPEVRKTLEASAAAPDPQPIASPDPQAMIDAMLKQAEAAMTAPESEASSAHAAAATPGAAVNADLLTGLLATDTQRMISEVELLSAHADEIEAGSDPLLDKLDTDKLLAEVSSLTNDQNLSENAQDDLFAEFKDEKGNES